MNDGKVACNNLKGRKRHADWSIIYEYVKKKLSTDMSCHYVIYNLLELLQIFLKHKRHMDMNIKTHILKYYKFPSEIPSFVDACRTKTKRLFAILQQKFSFSLSFVEKPP